MLTSFLSFWKSDIADFHSGFNEVSYYARNIDTTKLSTKSSVNYSEASSLMWEYSDMRKEKGLTLHKNSSSKVFDYTKSGDTAYITFDNFTMGNYTTSQKSLLSSNPADDTNLDTFCKDTMGLVIWSHNKIVNDPSIKNVVIDLSCNGGGAVTALTYISAWILGKSTINLRNSLTGDLSSVTCLADTNLDNDFYVNKLPSDPDLDSLKGLKDSGRDLNIFCITSPASFSCGNCLPSLLQESGMVTLVGQTSGGGACCVGCGSLADTTLFQYSSTEVLCQVKNGSFYDIDQGIEPNVTIQKNKFKDYVYDRTEMTKIINKICNFEIINNAQMIIE